MDYIKNGLKVFKGYAISLVLFGVFLYAFIAITGDSFSSWLPVYSILIFLLTFLIIYTDMKSLAKKEKRPQYDLNPYPLKGLIFGVIGFFPFILLELIYPLIVFDDPVANRIKELALKTLLGPVFFVLRFGGATVAAYAVASMVIPITAMLGYMAGYYDFSLNIFKKKQKDKKK